jgi:hypothetical protein
MLFGGKKIPETARGLGKGLNEFKKGTQGLLFYLKFGVGRFPIDVSFLAISKQE